MKIALISCTKLKQKYKCEAQEMYLPSTLYKKILKYKNNKKYDMWFILSAKYGLLKPNQIIEPYDLSLNNQKKEYLVKWANNVYQSLNEYLIDEVDIYAGLNYRKYLIPLLQTNNIKCNVPIQGMGIGQQFKYLSTENYT